MSIGISGEVDSFLDEYYHCNIDHSKLSNSAQSLRKIFAYLPICYRFIFAYLLSGLQIVLKILLEKIPLPAIQSS